MKKGKFNFGISSLIALPFTSQILRFKGCHNGAIARFRQPFTLPCLLLTAFIIFGSHISPAAAFEDDSISAGTAEQKDSPSSTPKMGSCQFYVKTEALVNGQKKTVINGAGAYINTHVGGDANAECKGTCDMKGPNGGECGCGYMSTDLEQSSGKEDADGNPIMIPWMTIHACKCVELVEE